MGLEIVNAMKEIGIDFVVTLPDSRLHDIIAEISQEKVFIHVGVTREEEGIGICAGAYLGGRRPAMVIQNAGFLNSINALTTLNSLYDIPVLLFISYRGGYGENCFFHVPLGQVTEPILRDLDIPYYILKKREEINQVVADAQTLADASKKPVAILLNKDVLGG